MRFTRITIDKNQMDGVPCIRHLRIPVATVVAMVADGMSVDEILKKKISKRPCISLPVR